MAEPVKPGVSTAAGISSTVSIPVELVTPTVIGSSSTQSNGISIVLDRRRPSVESPSTVNGTIASSTVTDAIVRSSCCGIRDAHADLAGLELDPADVELVRLRRVRADQADERGAGRDVAADDEREQHDRDERPEPPAQLPASLRCPRLHQSATLKKPIQPSSANSDWCAWNMKRPVFANSSSITPRWPWHCMTVSVYSR